MKAISIGSVILFVLFGADGLFAQTPTPAPKEDIVKISTTLIQVDATVVDKKGNIVRNLAPDDFEIYENGQKQKITHFSFIEPPPSAITKDRTSAKESPFETNKVPPLPIKLRPEQIKRTVALVVDDLGLSFSTIANVKESLKKYVDNQMQFGDLVAIIRTGAGAGFLQQFTSDKRILYTAIDKIRWNPRGVGRTTIFGPIDPSDKGAIAPDTSAYAGGANPEAVLMAADANAAAAEYRAQVKEIQEDVFAVGSLGAVNYVIQGMSRLPGRKAVVLFSEGFKLYTQDQYQLANNLKAPSPRLLNAMQNLTEAANRGGVIIYPVDARGVVNGLMINSEDSFDELYKMPGRESASANAGIERSTELMETQQGLRALAEATGGVAFVNNNDLNLGIERALNDQSGYYLLGYQPNEETFDPKKIHFNKLTVKLTNPNLRVRYRSGFYGIKDGDGSDKPKTERAQIYGALASPLEGGDLNLQLASVFANDAKAGNFIRTMIWVDGASLTFVDDGNGWQTARYGVVAMLYGEKDTVVDEISRKQTIKASAATLAEIKEKGFVATILVPVKKPGAYQVRVVIRDDVSSRIGSANEFIQVPNIKKNQLFVSGLLLQRFEDPSVPAAGQTALPPQFQPDDERDLAIRTFHPGMRLRLGFGIYNAKVDNASRSADLSIRYRIFRDGVEVYSSPESKLSTLDQSDSHRIVGEEEIKLSATAQSGSYILQMIVRDNLAQENSRVTYQFTDFDVAP